MKTFSKTELELNVAPIVEILKQGGLVVAPTDTSYGLLTNATSRKSVDKLLKLKDRPVGKAISVFVNGIPMMEQYVDINSLPASTLELLPGSYTIVLPSLGKVSELVEAEDKTLGVRYIKDDLINTIVNILGFPITATSANITGKNPAYSKDAFLNQLSQERLKLIDAVIDGGELSHNPPSTVISFAGHKPVLLRANTDNYIFKKLYRSKSLEDTEEIADEVNRILINAPGEKSIVILLDGDLGSGKTTWTKFLAKKYNITNIVSPTYNYECEYNIVDVNTSKKLLRHFDLYNIIHEEDLESLKLDRCLEKDSINVFEWPAQINKDILNRFVKDSYLVRMHFEYKSETKREITVFHN
ncbi:MAG: L-threonylcarbamoyladenylate synthase [Patescibacteria group bacterium]